MASAFDRLAAMIFEREFNFYFTPNLFARTVPMATDLVPANAPKMILFEPNPLIPVRLALVPSPSFPRVFDVVGTNEIGQPLFMLFSFGPSGIKRYQLSAAGARGAFALDAAGRIVDPDASLELERAIARVREETARTLIEKIRVAA